MTASLVTIGVVFVLLFISISGSFKNMMIGQMTDSMLGHLEVHRRGYLASIDNLPLNLNLKLQAYQKLEGILKQQSGRGSVFPSDKIRGNVQHLCGDDQHQAKRGLSGPGIQNRPAPAFKVNEWWKQISSEGRNLGA